MRRIMAPLILLLLTAPLFWGPPTASAAPSTVDSYGTANQDAGIGLSDHHPSDSASRSSVGQSFAVGAATYRLNTVSFYMSKLGAPTGTAYVRIYAHAGVYGASSLPNGAALASSDGFNVATLPGAYQLITFTFSGANQILLNPATNYVVVFENPAAGTIDGGNYPIMGYDNSAPTHGGNRVEYVNGAWAFDAADDAVFYVYGWDTSYNAFYFDNAVYENNTDAGSVTVTAVLPSGSEDLTVDGTDWWYSSEMPTYFTWEVSPGIYRRIYVDGEENFTITLPEDTFTAFGFTVKDFTGETEGGTVYLETRRTIGGTERIVERAPVQHTINLITMTLVENRNYVIQFTVGATIYQYAFFSSSLDTTPIIVLNEITFSRTIQLSGTYIHVDADRPTTTSLRVNYTNTRADTNLVQIAVREMDGTLVGSTNIASDAFTYTYSPVNNETSYYFDLTIDTDLWDPTWKKTLPWEPVFVGLPDPFTVLGTVGSLDTSRIMGFLFIMFTALLFSAKDVTIGCFSVAITTSLMSYWGFFPVDNTILALVVGMSVLVGLGLRGR